MRKLLEHDKNGRSDRVVGFARSLYGMKHTEEQLYLPKQLSSSHRFLRKNVLPSFRRTTIVSLT